MTAGCSDRTCVKLGRSPFVFGLIEYGAPVVAWALLVAGFAVLTMTFQTPLSGLTIWR